MSPYVCISWGSGVMGSWGLWVGQTNFVFPDHVLPSYMSYHAWKPGIYFWEDLH